MIRDVKGYISQKFRKVFANDESYTVPGKEPIKKVSELLWLPLLWPQRLRVINVSKKQTLEFRELS